jgi:hypothetical protein
MDLVVVLAVGELLAGATTTAWMRSPTRNVCESPR